MIASHNTFSYLPVQKWWMKLLTPWHKCQSNTLLLQLIFDKVDYLDIRVRFDKDDNPVFVHNNIIYRTPYNSPFDYLLNIMRLFNTDRLSKNNRKKIPFRLILDVRKIPEDCARQIKLFYALVDTVQKEPYSSYLILDEARIFWDWDIPVIRSKYDIHEIHTSVCSKWYQYILGTKWFAKKHNSRTCQIEKENKDKVYFIDYVNLGK